MRGICFQRIEILRKTLPGEIDAFGQHRLGNIFDAFHQVNQKTFRTGPHRREADTAIAEHGSRHAMPGGGREIGIPCRLAVVMSMNIDPARREQQTFGVDFALART